MTDTSIDKPQVPRFNSMAELIDSMQTWPKELPFPLREGVDAEKMIIAWKEETKKTFEKRVEEFEKWAPRLSAQDCIALLAYEDNAQKLEQKLNMSSMHMWVMAYMESSILWRKKEHAVMTPEDMAQSFKSLLNNGANLKAAEVTVPHLPLFLISRGLINEFVALTEAGYSLTKPYTFKGYFSAAREIKYAPFITSLLLSSENDLKSPEAIQNIRIGIQAALAQGCSVDDLDSKGQTALYYALKMTEGKELRGPIFAKELLELGADPRKIAPHPLALCADSPMISGAALALYQSDTLSQALSHIPMEKKAASVRV